MKTSLLVASTFLSLTFSIVARADLPADLREVNAKVFTADDERTAALPQVLSQDAQSRMQAANVRENAAWEAVKSRADWEAYRDQRLAALRRSLGEFPPVPEKIDVRVTGTIEGDGFRIRNIVYPSRPGLIVTANLYLPAKPGAKMPAIVISHSQHNPKHQGELQDMGMTWARAGCVVLVPDVLGHGERRQHPFTSAATFPQQFAVGRQDYYFRYLEAMQLHVVGESLVGWMVWDLMRAVDVVLAQPGVDPARVVLLGSVAGGGDPAGIAAALDSRIAAVAPFNFGGPQPDYAVPENAARDFYFFGVPTWESTRCLRLGARDGFSHWLIVSAVAPRRLIYSHEFGWDEARDPAWPRMQRVFGFYDQPGNLTVAHGNGNLKGRPPEHTHCNNIGALHRGKFYPALQRWFDMPPPQEYEQRRTVDELACLTPEAAKELQPKFVHQLAAEIGSQRAAAARKRLDGLKPDVCRHALRQEWFQLLGDVTPQAAAKATSQGKQSVGGVTVERLALETEPGIYVPTLLLVPARQPDLRLPVVVAVSQSGKQSFLQQRSEAVSEWLNAGLAVCLPDVRGTGETYPGSRHWRSATAHSQHELMLGQTLLGSRLRDVRSVLRYLGTRSELAADRIGLWGDSFAPVNAADRDLKVPLDAITEKFPAQAEPLGGLLALLGGLFEDRVQSIAVNGGLVSFQSLLDSQFVYVPHDAVVPGALTTGDLTDIAAALSPRSLSLNNLVDGQNRSVSADAITTAYAAATVAYKSAQSADRLRFNDPTSAKSFALSLTAVAEGKQSRLPKLEPNRWTLIHEPRPGESTFRRQPHGGSCFDSRRNRLVLFGSDSHGRDFTNSPLYFRTETLTWSRAYPDDPREAYRVTDDGLAVAGDSAHPWATHTFGSVVYDSRRDEAIVPIFDDHLVPGRFTNSFQDLWPRIKRRPTWLFDCSGETWTALPGNGVSCFPYCAAYDSDRGVVVAVRPEGIHELSGEPRTWRRVTQNGFFGWHTNCAYDAKHKAVVVFGSNENSNDVAVYFPARGEYVRQPTPGLRPPKDQHNPMEFHPDLGRTVVLIDRVDGSSKQTETWLYELGQDAWQQLDSATLPFACGMNYNLEFDPANRLLWLVTGGDGSPTRVWALRMVD